MEMKFLFEIWSDSCGLQQAADESQGDYRGFIQHFRAGAKAVIPAFT